MRTIVLISLLLFFSSCASRKGVPYTQPLLSDSRQVLDGKVLFDQYCHSCHPGGSSGLGPSLNDKPLPGFLIRFQIRRGMGVMPAFSEEVISDENSKKIVAYMKALRKLD